MAQANDQKKTQHEGPCFLRTGQNDLTLYAIMNDNNELILGHSFGTFSLAYPRQGTTEARWLG